MNPTPIADVVVPGQQWPDRHEVPPHIQGRYLLQFLDDMLAHFKGDRVSFSYVRRRGRPRRRDRHLCDLPWPPPLQVGRQD